MKVRGVAFAAPRHKAIVKKKGRLKRCKKDTLFHPWPPQFTHTLSHFKVSKIGFIYSSRNKVVKKKEQEEMVEGRGWGNRCIFVVRDKKWEFSSVKSSLLCWGRFSTTCPRDGRQGSSVGGISASLTSLSCRKKSVKWRYCLRYVLGRFSVSSLVDDPRGRHGNNETRNNGNQPNDLCRPLPSPANVG